MFADAGSDGRSFVVTAYLENWKQRIATTTCAFVLEIRRREKKLARVLAQTKKTIDRNWRNALYHESDTQLLLVQKMI